MVGAVLGLLVLVVLEADMSSNNCWHYLASKNSLGCRVGGRGLFPLLLPPPLLLGLETGKPPSGLHFALGWFCMDGSCLLSGWGKEGVPETQTQG